MSPIFYFVARFSRCFLFLSLVFSAFVVGNCGLGGTTLVTFTTFIASVLWYGVYCALLGPPEHRERNPWMQGLVMVIHGGWAFASVLAYVWFNHFRLDDSLSFAEGWRYWKNYLPYSFGVIALVSFVFAWLSMLEWLETPTQDASVAMGADFWDGYHKRRR